MESLDKSALINAKRIVIKVGSNLIINPKNGTTNKTLLKNIVKEIKLLLDSNREVMLVSSGAVSLGKKVLNINKSILQLDKKQAAASIGQIILINAWKEAFDKKNIISSQILLSHNDAENRKNALNARDTLEELIRLKAIPIINENDTVATLELRYGDNDQLAARVAQISSANLLVLLTDVSGLHTKNPSKNPSATLIKRIEKITPKIEKIAEDSNSTLSVGGMITKLKAAKIAMSSGCHVIIANGKVKNPISSLFKDDLSTWFISKSNPKSARKRWISSQVEVKGNMFIDLGAVNALKTGSSLLPAGVKKISGRFEKGDAVNVYDNKNKLICVGLSSYPSIDAKTIVGRKTNEIKNLIGYQGKEVMIHRNDLVIKN